MTRISDEKEKKEYIDAITQEVSEMIAKDEKISISAAKKRI